MGDKTGITWTDMTFNPWIGCTKVSQGCKFCYAETQNKHYGWNPNGWEPGVPRHRTSKANWRKPYEWAKKARADGVVRRVFCASLADVLDPEVPEIWRQDLYDMIADIGNYQGGGLEWLLLTKRPEEIEHRIMNSWLRKPPDYVRLGITAEDQENADKRIPQLLWAWEGHNFISYEPAIGPIDIRYALWSLDWVICGGESGAGCRPMDLDWARSIRDQCKNDDVPFFFKQIGGYPDKRHDPEGWPEDLRIREFPGEVRS